MPGFLGNNKYAVDDKGRLSIPAKWRKLLSAQAQETFVISQAPGGCLRAYPMDEWERFEARLSAAQGGMERDRMMRVIANTLNDSALDKQGRITLTPLQMQAAAISKNVTLVGMSRYVEIWDSDRYEKYLSTSSNFDETYYSATSNI